MKSKNVQIPRIAECMNESEAKLDSIITQIERFLDEQKFTNEEFAKILQSRLRFVYKVNFRVNFKF
jgi:predicted transcriptional regulator